MITFLIAGILVGAVIGICVGYLMSNGDDSDSNNSGEQTYWFYIDFNEDETGATNDNMWISASANDPIDALKKAFEANDVDYDMTTFVSSVDGVDATGTLAWLEYVWVGNVYESYFWGWVPTVGLDSTIGNTFYIVYTGFAADYSPLLKPNAEVYWKGAGPFPAE